MSIRIAHSHVKEADSVKEYSYSQNKNFPTRQYMEDSIYQAQLDFIAQDNFPIQKGGLFAILDGHGGAKVSQYCVEAIPRIFQQEFNLNKDRNISKIFIKVCSTIDKEVVQLGAEDVGSTCCMAYFRTENNKRLCTIGNLGDTRAVLCQNGKARRVTVDHKVLNQNEQKRIKSEGGYLLQGRVGGQLAITRALGDLSFKTIGVSNVPQIQEFEIDQMTTFLIIASDGLWDVCEDSKAVELVKDLPSTKEMSKTLMQFATKSGSKDNISVLVIKF